MTLNFSHRPIFPSHLSEDNLVSPMRIANGCLLEGIPERSGDGFARPWHSNRNKDGCFKYGRGDRVDRSGSLESAPSDVLDLLPSDPFGMDISTTFTALTCWLEDLEVDYGGCVGNSVWNPREEYNLFNGLNFIWNNGMQFQAFPRKVHFGNSESNTARQVDGCTHGKGDGNVLTQGGFVSVPTVCDAVIFCDESTSTVGQGIQCRHEVSESCPDGDGEAPHAGLLFALGFLGVRDILSVDRVCRYLHLIVRSETLLWRSIHIDQPLNERITDDVLFQLTNRAQGNLQCLSLVECPRITDNGLKCVLENNPRLTKLCVPGCTRLSIEGIVNSLKDFKCKGAQGIKHLRIGGLYGVMNEHFEKLKLLLGADIHNNFHNDHKPHFYHRGNLYLLCDDERAIDIDICPRCQKLRLVYDCPAEGCQKRGGNVAGKCRACRLCIPRCVQCGFCINDNEYEETFCLEWLCSDCSKQLLKSPDGKDGKDGLSRKGGLQDLSYTSSCYHG